MRVLLGFGFLALSGCASAIQPYTAPDGRAAYAMNCGSMTACYDKARELCGGNYDVLDKVDNATTVGTAGNTYSARDQRLYIACKTTA